MDFIRSITLTFPISLKLHGLLKFLHIAFLNLKGILSLLIDLSDRWNPLDKEIVLFKI